MEARDEVACRSWLHAFASVLTPAGPEVLPPSPSPPPSTLSRLTTVRDLASSPPSSLSRLTTVRDLALSAPREMPRETTLGADPAMTPSGARIQVGVWGGLRGGLGHGIRRVN
jgi:hypothetical protein